MTENGCKVCGNSPATLNYNAVVCNPCRVFFFRSVTYGPPDSCEKGDCVMIPERRRNCPSCRFNKCLSMKMDVNRVGQLKKYSPLLQVRSLSPSTMINILRQFHPLLFASRPISTPGSIDEVLIWHRFSLNGKGPSPSSSPANLNVSIADVLLNPTIAASRGTACFEQICSTKFDPTAKLSLPRSVCRWLVTHIDFLVSTHYFNGFNSVDKKHILCNSFTDFQMYCLMEHRRQCGRSPDKAFCDRFRLRENEKKCFYRSIDAFDRLYFVVLEPTYDELKLDQVESTAIKIIAMFFPNVELSDDGLKKAAFARNAYSLKLMDYICWRYPGLTREQKLIRCSKLLGIIKEVRKVGEIWRMNMTEAVINNYGGLSGKLTFELFVKAIT